MYEIINIVYGYPITAEISAELDRLEQDESSNWAEGEYPVEFGCCGFVTPYSGMGGIRCGYVGVLLESVPAFKYQPKNWKVTAKQKADAKNAIAFVRKEYPTLAKLLVGQPKVCCVTSTS